MVQGEPGHGVLNPAATRLEVWGDPIAHSKSPALHAAAYAVLGLPWYYDRRRVAAADFSRELDSLGEEVRGLSVTFPLKGEAFAAARQRDAAAELSGAVNTLLLTADGPLGFNTDVGGLVAALREFGVADARSARLIGAGATATSAFIALARVGTEHVEVVARRSEAIDALRPLAAELGLTLSAASFDAPTGRAVDVSIATLPGAAPVEDRAADALAATGGPLLDVVYGHWPTTVAAAWERAAAPATNGLGMLLHQAVLQIRIFLHGDPDVPLRDEESVLAEMRSAVVGD